MDYRGLLEDQSHRLQGADDAGTLLTLSQNDSASGEVLDRLKGSLTALKDIELQLQSIIELTVDYYWEQNTEQRFTRVLGSATYYARHDPGSFDGKTFWEVSDYPVTAVSVWNRYQAFFNAREPIRDFVICQLDSHLCIRYSSISGDPVFNKTGDFVGYNGVVRDVTKEKKTEDFISTFELAPLGIAHVNRKGRFIEVNRKLCEMLGYAREELLQLTVKEISHPEDRNSTDVMRSQILLGEIQSFKIEKRYLKKDNSVLWVGLTTTVKRGPGGQVLFDIALLEDISAQKAAEDRVRYLATHDEMTGLPNRTLFQQLLQHAVETSRRYERSFAVLFIDLDRFKQINDALGHKAGDELLEELSRRFQSALRSSDVVARLGGDEFVVLAQEVKNKEQVSAVAQNILATTLRPFIIRGQECLISASVGISMFPCDGDDEHVLMKNADIAMYLAKEEGKNTYHFYAGNNLSHSMERLALESHLRRALELDELEVHYQPKVAIDSGEITGVEALLRWNNPELGMISPVQFIPLAEELGLIIPIGRWVLKQACMQVVHWRDMGLPDIQVAVNISPRQFSDPEFIDYIKRVIDVSTIRPEQLELEITESLVMQHADKAIAMLRQLRAIGICIAIDDFGTGYSSLSQLRDFPVDTLKVDRSFVKELETSEEDRAITKAIVTMGKTLGLTVVAEGVENIMQLNFLALNDCDLIQGYYFSKPLPSEKFEALLRTGIKNAWPSVE